jgi:multicomponent Na+:H+ antiporter subunit A
MPWHVTGDDVFTATLRGLVLVAQRTAATVQSGSLPVYVATILVVVVGTPVVAAVLEGDWPAQVARVELNAHVPLALALAVGGVAVAAARRRFAAVLLLGGVGYTMALLFAVQGAPDLALTQFAVETLLVIVFVLVIRHLPKQFAGTPTRIATATRLAVAGAVGASVFVLALLTAMGSPERQTSEAIIEQSVPSGGGRNVVNVILVDVRGLDTLGEVTVLVVAAVGVTAVARVGRRPAREEQPT